MSKLSYCLKKDARYFWREVRTNCNVTHTYREFEAEFISINEDDYSANYDYYVSYLHYLCKNFPETESILFDYFERNFFKLGWCQLQRIFSEIDDALVVNDDSEPINSFTDSDLVASIYSALTCEPEAISAIKCFTRFGKRFTPRIPFGYRPFRASAYKALLANNNRCKQLNRTLSSSYSAQYIIEGMKKYTKLIEDAFFEAYVPCKDVYSFDSAYIPNGGNYEGLKTQSQKLAVIAAKNWGLFPHQLVPVDPDLDSYTHWRINTPWRKKCHRNRCRFESVPKTFTGDRGISLMEINNTVNLHHPVSVLMDVLDKATFGAIKIFDQEQNRDFCFNASVFDLATIDLSAASDSICYSLVRQLFSSDFLNIFDTYRADVIEYHDDKGGIRYDTLHIYGLMGEKDTFPFESIIFWALYRACCDVNNAFQETPYSCVDPRSITIYGDDGICDAQLVPLLFHFMESLGFKPNRSKSYYGDQRCTFQSYGQLMFRESCGRDVLVVDGFITILPQLYLPRGGYKEGNYKVVQLIDFQHRAIEFGCTALSDALVSNIVKYLGDERILTYSEVGSEYQDIWCADVPSITYHYAYAPVADGCQPPEWTFRPLHMSFESVSEQLDKSRLGTQCANWYAYQEFLRVGPCYDSPLDELLGVSTRWVTTRSLTRKETELQLSYKE